MDEALIQREVQDNILMITLNRPEKRNAFTLEMVNELAEAVRSVDEKPDIRAIIVQGEGSVFSAGIDVMSLMQAKTEAGDQNPARWLRRIAADLQHALQIIETTEVPIIGALHGHVIGLGLELALTFDLRVATDACLFSIPEARLGLVADVGGTTRLSRVVGPSRAKDMLMTARTVDAHEALAWGLVNRVAPPDSMVSEAVNLAQKIAQNAPLAVGLAKLIIDHGDGLDKQTQMVLERWAQSQLITTADVGEGVMAAMQKRAPDFKGN